MIQQYNIYSRHSLMKSNQYIYYLYPATVQVILGAFGQRDGKAVINATNAYLNQLAASDRDKATALVGFINEDPMMVCSLGIEVEGVTMPIRWLVGDGVAYINTGYVYKAEDIVVRFRSNGVNDSAGGNWLCGVRESISGQNAGFGFNYWGTSVGYPYRNYGDVGTQYRDGNHKAPAELYLTRAKVSFVYNGNVVLDTPCTTLTTDFQTTNPFYILCMNRTDVSAPFNGDLRDMIMSKGGVVSHHFIPCKHNGQCGVYDIEGMTWHGNSASSGTLTIPDISYTPSTP